MGKFPDCGFLYVSPYIKTRAPRYKSSKLTATSIDAKTFSRVAVSNLATALLWFALNYVQQSLARQQSEFEESDEWEHTKNLLEHPASGSQVTAATKFIGDISEGTENGKVKSDRVTADTLPR